MPSRVLGNYVRERRMSLGLTQEQLAARISESATQAEISRLERGVIGLPRRGRLDALAAALEVSLGTLLLHSGWLTDEERQAVDELPEVQQRTEGHMILAELAELREGLATILDRVAWLEATLRGAPVDREGDPLEPVDP